MRVKLAASSRLRGSQHLDSYVNDPTASPASDSSDMVVQNPYKLLVPTTVTPTVPLVLVAAFHLAQAPISQGERFQATNLHKRPEASHAKLKSQKKRAHATSKSSSEPSQAHSKKIRIDTAISQQNYPYKLISPVGPVPTPPIILLSSATHSGIKKQRVKDNVSRQQHIGADVVVPKQHSDAHVSLKVISHTTKVKNSVGGDGVGGKEKVGVAVSKFRLTKSVAPELPKKPGTTASKNVSNGKNNRRTNVAWHPGMVSICGITYINPSIAAASLSQNSPPPVTIGNPIDRVTLMKPPKDFAPEFSAEDPVAGSVQYLKYLALSVGRLPPFAARAQHEWNVRQKVHRDRLERIARVRGDFPENTRQYLRRSSRAKGSMGELSNHPHSLLEAAQRQELALGPKAYSKEERDRNPCLTSSVRIKVATFDPADLTDVRLGVEYQAQPPPAARRPAFPRPEEARWVEGFIIHGERSQKYVQQASKDIYKEPAPEKMTSEARQRLLDKKTMVLVNKLGQEAAASLGVGKMGLRMVSRLKEQEQEAFGKGMRSNDRDFYQISKSFLPDFQPRILAEYYYDVWKLRGTEAAKEWYKIRQAEKEAALEAQAAAERQRVEDNARRLERQEATNRRRQVKEVLQWIRSSSRLPSTAVNYNKPVVRERAGRVANVLHLLAGDGDADV